MNWTGGRLQRHTKKGRGGIINKQKQHFAKARALGQSTRTTQDELIASLALGQQDVHDKTNCGSGTRFNRQSSLIEYPNTAPLAKRLSVLSNGHARRKTARRELEATSHSDRPGTNGSRQVALASRDRPGQIGSYQASASAPGERLRLSQLPTTGRDTHLQGASRAVKLPQGADLESMKQKLLQQKDWAKLRVVRASATLYHQPRVPQPSAQGMRTQHDTAPRMHIPSIGAGEWDNLPGTAKFAAAVRDEFKVTIDDATSLNQRLGNVSTYEDNDGAISSDSLLMDIDVHDLDFRPADGPHCDDIFEVDSQSEEVLDTVESIHSNRGNASSFTHLARGIFADGESVDHDLNKKTSTRPIAAEASIIPLLSGSPQSETECSMHTSGVAEGRSTRSAIGLRTFAASSEHSSPVYNNDVQGIVQSEKEWPQLPDFPQDSVISVAIQSQAKRRQPDCEAGEASGHSNVEHKESAFGDCYIGRTQASEIQPLGTRRKHALVPNQNEGTETALLTLSNDPDQKVVTDIELRKANVDPINIAAPPDKSLEDLWKAFVFGKPDPDYDLEKISDDGAKGYQTSSPPQDFSLIVHDSGSVHQAIESSAPSMDDENVDQPETSIDAASISVGTISRPERRMSRSSPDPLALDVSLIANHAFKHGSTSVPHVVFHRPTPFKGKLVQHMGSKNSISLEKSKRRSLRIAEHGLAMLEVPEDAIED